MNITTKNIDVFPISYSRSGKSDARILTEQHIMNIAKIATAAKDASYVISETLADNPFEFMLSGYHVEIANNAPDPEHPNNNGISELTSVFNSGSIYAKCVFVDGNKLADDYTDTEDEELLGTYGGVVFLGTAETGALEILKKDGDDWKVPVTSSYTIDGGEI